MEINDFDQYSNKLQEYAKAYIFYNFWFGIFN